MRHILLIFLALTGLASPAAAWSAQGHRLIAEMAYERLTSRARTEVDRLIATGAAATVEGCAIRSLGDASVWPDCVRGDSAFAYLSTWHYDDIPVCARADRRSYCARGACATAAIERARRVLANRRSGDRARLLALAQLAHFIGDIHQPLHAADNNDRGGNDVLVIYMGSTTFVGADGLSRAHNLHGFWDGPLVAVALGNDPIVAHEMIESLMRAHARAWSIGNPMQWAAESHSIAVRFTYGALPWETVCGARPATPVSISDEYVRSAVPIVREQLARAALRLARELNAALP